MPPGLLKENVGSLTENKGFSWQQENKEVERDAAKDIGAVDSAKKDDLSFGCGASFLSDVLRFTTCSEDLDILIWSFCKVFPELSNSPCRSCYAKMHHVCNARGKAVMITDKKKRCYLNKRWNRYQRYRSLIPDTLVCDRFFKKREKINPKTILIIEYFGHYSHPCQIEISD